MTITRASRLLAALLTVTAACATAFAQPDTDAKPDHASATSVPPEALRVMSFNIRFGSAPDGENAWPHRNDRVIDVIRGDGTPERPGFDLVGLQEAEAFQLDEILEALPGYRSIGVGREDGKKKGEFSPILYRPDRLRPRESGTRWLSDTPSVPGSKSWGNNISRILTWAEFERRGDAGEGRVFFVNTHFDHQSQPSREESAAAVTQWIRQSNRLFLPRIVTGDFNAPEDNPAMRWLRNDGELRDAWRDLNPDAPEPETFSAWKNENREGRKIDVIFIDEHWKTLDASIDRRGTPDGRSPSDHFPVTATLTLDETPADESVRP